MVRNCEATEWLLQSSRLTVYWFGFHLTALVANPDFFALCRHSAKQVPVMPNNLLTVCLVDIALIDPDNWAGVKPPVGIRRKTAEYARRFCTRCYWAGLVRSPFFPLLAAIRLFLPPLADSDADR